MKLRLQRFGVAMLVYVLGVVCIATTSYWLEQQRYMEEIDARLFAAASNVPSILPSNFHDIARTSGAISEEQDLHNLELMSQHARTGNLTYLYSYVMYDDMIHFTSCNYTKKDVENDQVVTYWTSYPEGSKEYFDVMNATEPVYVTAGDRWGLFRTILIPLKSPGGQPYVAAADMDITVIQQSLMRKVLSIIAVCLLLFLLAIPFLLAYRHTYADMNRKLIVLNKQLKADINQAQSLEIELKKANQEAVTATKIKSQFLANMSHELRTPINGVLGMNQLLLDTQLSPDQREYAVLANRCANVLLDTINQILDVAAIEEGGLVIQPEPIASVRFFDDIAMMFSSQIAEKRLELTLHIENSLPEKIDVDPVRLRQIITNLIANAIKFTKHGGVQVMLRWQDGMLFGSILDCGIGIPSDAQKRIFETFQQVDNSNTRRYGGTGLGLPISRQVCRSMGGDLQLEHSDSHGSKFTFRTSAPACSGMVSEQESFPYESKVVVFTESDLLFAWLKSQLWPTTNEIVQVNAIDHAMAEINSASLVLVDGAVESADLTTLNAGINYGAQRLVLITWAGQQLPDVFTGKIQVLQKPLIRRSLFSLYVKSDWEEVENKMSLSGRVLIVDDNLSNLKAMGDQIKNTGLEIHIVQNGTDAVNACEHYQFDLVLMDIQMPVMDGLEATRRIRHALGEQAPPIVGVSAHVMEDDVDTAKQAGMVDYLCKPITKEALLGKIAEILG